MAHWSSYGDFDTNELEPCCRKGHQSSFLLQTETGGRICLSCLSSLISDGSAFLIHRTYAINEFLMALKDEHFSSGLMTYHNHLLVTPLCEAIGSSKDVAFCQSVMDSVLTMCVLAENHGKNVVEDFVLQIARHISAPSQWNRTQWHTLHLMGLLLDLYCKHNKYLPDAIKTQRGFLPNLISFLQNPGAEFRGEVLFVLFKIASLEDGTDDLLRYCPEICKEAVHALLQSDSDESKINCLALLTILGERFVLKIEFCSDLEDEKRQFPLINRSHGKQTPSLARTFIQAIKGCLLSSDSQIQASALRLINLVYSDKIRLRDGLRTLVEEGIVDYVLETLRLSEEQETVQSLALDVLTLVSGERPLYMQRFPIVLQTLIPMLDKSVDALSVKLQKDTLDLISGGVFQLPGVLLAAHSEDLLAILSRLFQQHKAVIEESVWSGGTVSLPPTFYSACSTLIALIEAPSCSEIRNASQILHTATKYAVEFAATDARMNPGLLSLKISVRLIQAAYEYNERQVQQNELTLKTQGNLIDLCDEYLFPAFADSVEKMEDVDLVSIVFKTLTLILRTCHRDKAAQFAERLAMQKCFTLSYDLLVCFASPLLKEKVYQFMSSVIKALVGASVEESIVKGFSYLPSNPTSLLLLLEQKSKEDKHLRLAQYAIISILSISTLYNDRLASEIDIISSLEQHLLLNEGSTLTDTVASDETLQHFLSLYVRGKRILEDCNISSSLQAEKVLEAVLNHSTGRKLLCSETPKDILRWFLHRDPLRNFTMVQLLTWFTTGQNMCSDNQLEIITSSSRSPGGKEGFEHLSTLAEILVEEPCATNVLVSLFYWLFSQGNGDGVGAVVRTLTRLACIAPSVGHQLLCFNLEHSLVPLIHPQAVKASTQTRRFCLELLFQMLVLFDNNLGITLQRSWLDVADQCAYFILVKAKAAFDEEVLPYLSLVNMMLFKSNEGATLLEASNVLACNRELSTRMEDHIIRASAQGEKLSKIDFSSTEGQVLCSAMIFHLLRLRWALKHKYALREDETPYVGFHASNWSKTDDCSKGFGTSVTCKELCKILYHGPTTLKILASCCIAEIFSQLHTPVVSESSDTVKILDLPSTFFMSVTMTLQGSTLEDLGLVSKNASSSLFLLLNSPALCPQRKRIVANNPWNRMLVEHLLAFLSAAERDGATCTCGRSPCFAAYIALGILRVTPSVEWLPVVFSPRIISDLVANLSEDKISPNIICIFRELLLMKYLSNDHLIKLRNLFKTVRKSLYEYGSTLQDTEIFRTLHNNNLSCIAECINHFPTDNDLQSALLELVVQSSVEAGGNLCTELDLMSITSNASGVACISVIDKFIQDSNFSD